MQKLYSLAEVAAITGIKEVTWRVWAAQRRVPIVRLGRRIKIRESDLERFISENFVPALREG
jgi:excisionase family DNA binding protein